MGSKRRREPPEEERVANGDPGFATKLGLMIEDPGSKGVVQWCADMRSFAIYSPQRFEDGLLRKYFSELDLQAFFGKLQEFGFEVQRETVWVALHPSHAKNTNKPPDELTELVPDALRRRVADTVVSALTPTTTALASPPLPTQLGALLLPTQLSGLSEDSVVMSVLAKMIDHQAAMLQTMQRMEKEVEQTRAHQQALVSILESLSEPNTPSATGAGEAGGLALAEGRGNLLDCVQYENN